MENTNSDWLKADTHFVIIPNWILLADISDGAVRLYGVLRKYADNNTGTAFPSRATLAKDMHKSRDSIDRYVKELVELGALAVTHRKKAGTYANQVNLYTLVSTSPNDVAAPVRLGGRIDAAREPQGCGTELEPLNYTQELDPPLDAVDEIDENALPPISDEIDAHTTDKYGFTPEGKQRILNMILSIYAQGSWEDVEAIAIAIEEEIGIDASDAVVNYRWDERLWEIVGSEGHSARYNAGTWLSELLNWNREHM